MTTVSSNEMVDTETRAPTPRRQRLRQALTRHDVLAAALELIDRDGLGELSMRKLAGALGTDPMSLYKRVDNKDELLDGIAQLLWDEVAAAAPARHDLGDWLRSFGQAIVATVRAHPNALNVLFVRDVFPTSVLDVIAGQVDRLPGDTATDDVYQAVCTVGALALGCAALEHSYLGTPPSRLIEGADDPDVTERQRLRRVVRALPADTPDRLVDTALAVCGSDCADVFDVGLELIIRGCQPQPRAE